MYVQGIMLRTLLGVSNAMEWLHVRNVLHGDLKCANVMLHVNNMSGADGEAGVGEPNDDLELVPKVVDFGLSRCVADWCMQWSKGDPTVKIMPGPVGHAGPATWSRSFSSPVLACSCVDAASTVERPKALCGDCRQTCCTVNHTNNCLCACAG